MVNQGVPGTGVALQLSPHQMGTNLGPAALSPIDQQHLIQSATFDPQLAALQQSQAPQQVAFQNATGELMIQSPPQQLVLQSPNQQFTLQSPTQQFAIQNQNQFPTQNQNMAQFTPQQQIIPQAQGGNVILQGQNSGMIVQGDNFIQSGVNPGMFLHSPIVQNVGQVGQQIYGTTPNLLNNPMQGMFSQSQVLTNQNVGLISINQSPTGKTFVDNDKGGNSGQSSGLVNQQMQLLAQIAQHTSPESTSHNVASNLKPSQQTMNVVPQSQPMQSPANQAQSLPSFGHFLLHHHMQSLPHPFLQNLHIPSMAPTQATMSVDMDNGQTSKQFTSSAGTSNINAEFNNWNKGQVQGRARKNSSPVRSIAPNLMSKASLVLPSATVTQVQASLCDSRSAVTLASSVVSSSTRLESTVNKTNVTIPLRPASQNSHKQSSVKTVQSNTAVPAVKSETCPKSILVPYGWVRTVEGDSIVYYR